MNGTNEPTWVKVGDKIVSKVVEWSGMRFRYYGEVVKVVKVYETNVYGWQVHPSCAVAGVSVRQVVRASNPVEVRPITAGEILYENFLRVLTDDEWTRLETAGWPYDFQKFEKVFRLEAELAKTKGTMPNAGGLRIVKAGTP